MLGRVLSDITHMLEKSCLKRLPSNFGFFSIRDIFFHFFFFLGGHEMSSFLLEIRRLLTANFLLL